MSQEKNYNRNGSKLGDKLADKPVMHPCYINLPFSQDTKTVCAGSQIQPVDSDSK